MTPKNYFFKIFFLYKLPSTRKAKCLFHSLDVKKSRSALQETHAIMWEGALWLVGKHAGSTPLTPR